MTTAEKLQAKIRSKAHDDYLTDKELIPIFVHGANLLAPLLLETVELLKIHDMARSGLNIDMNLINKKTVSAINKFEAFINAN